MPVWIYLVPLAVLPVVMLLGFVGCQLDSEGQAPPPGPGTPTPDPYHTVIEATPGLVAYWPLGDQTGTTAHDAVGPPPNGSHFGTYEDWTAPADAATQTDAANGVYTLGQPGLVPNDEGRLSVAVDGGYVEVPFAPELNTPEFTFELLVHTSWDATAVAAYRCVLSSRELAGGMAGGNVGGFVLYANPANQWEARAGAGTPVPAAAVGDLIAFDTTEWLAITYDGLSLTLYVNGELSSSVQPEPGYVPNTSRPLLIGAREGDDLTVPIYPFKGRLQEVACYSRALSQGEINAHIEASKAEGPE
jgi:hypothetical protein